MSVDSYGRFANVYDMLTYDVNYEKYADFIEEIFKSNSLSPKLVLDLACGTGTMTKIFHRRGYDMIGIDASVDMLDIASEKCPDALFLNQSMDSFELYGTVDAIICMLDSVNYLKSIKQLKELFKLAYNYLNYDGVFAFDINSPHKLINILGNNTFVNEENNIFYTWENKLKKNSVEFFLNFFVKDKEKYIRFEEVHEEHIFYPKDVVNELKNSGFSNIRMFDNYSSKSPDDNCCRISFFCTKI